MRLGYILVEGYDDVGVIGGILKDNGLQRILKKKNVFEYWIPIIPKEFPYRDDLTKRVPVPAFFQDANISIAIHCAEGNYNKMAQDFRNTLITTIPNLKKDMVGIGIIGDADSDVSKTFDEVKISFNGLLLLPDTCGTISNGNPNTGVYLFPDNVNNGTLEKVLLMCAKESYKEILDQATLYISNVDNKLTRFDRIQFDKPAGKEKATIGCISNILRPGYSTQVSISQDNWVCKQSIESTDLSKLKKFLLELLQLS